MDRLMQVSSCCVLGENQCVGGGVILGFVGFLFCFSSGPHRFVLGFFPGS